MLLTFIALWLAYERYSGAKAWVAMKEELIANGVELDGRKLIPPMPDSESNFAATPLIAAITNFQFDEKTGNFTYENQVARKQFEKMWEVGKQLRSDSLPNWQLGTRVDWDSLVESLQENERVKLAKNGTSFEKLQDLLKQFESQFAELDAASTRPEAQIPTEFHSTFMENATVALPHLSEFRSLQKLLLIRMLVAIESNDEAEAAQSIRVMRKISDSIASSPILISVLVKMGLDGEMHSGIWVGLEKGIWSDQSLDEFSKFFARENYYEFAEKAMTMEMLVMQIQASDFLKTADRETRRAVYQSSMDLEEILDAVSFFPIGIWADHHRNSGCRFMLDHCILPMRSRQLPDEQSIRAATGKRNLRNIFISISGRSYLPIMQRVTLSVASQRLLRTACAIERYQNEFGELPGQLENLVPEFLATMPIDPVTNKNPLKYKIDDAKAGEYRLYSVGLDRMDDGGKVIFKGAGQGRERDAGDWVWAVPAIVNENELPRDN